MCMCIRCACVCASVQACVFVYVSVGTREPCEGQRTTFLLCVRQDPWLLTAVDSPWTLWMHLSPLPVSVGVLGLQMHASTSGFTWLLGIWAPVLRPVPVNTLSSGPSFLAFFYIPDTILMALKGLFREWGAGFCAFGSSWTAFNTVLNFPFKTRTFVHYWNILLMSVCACVCVEV